MSPNSNPASIEALAAAVLKLLKPLVRILLRYGVPYGAFADAAKRVYVEVASEDFGLPGRKQTVSRVSVLTGLSRKEVKRVSELAAPDDAETLQRYNRAARVIGGWLRDPAYTSPGAAPAELALDGDGATFTTLVKKYSGDVPARAILDELRRVGAVTLLDDHRVRLEARGYVPQAGEADKLAILGVDVSDLISCIDHNLRCEAGDAFFQRKVSYDNLPAAAAPELRERAAERAQGLLEELDAWMAAHDRDSNPGVAGEGRKRAALGIYYFEDDFAEDD